MWTIEDQFKIKLGGNHYIDVPNLIVARGESLFRVKRREEDGLLAVDFDVYRADGTKVATIRSAHVVSEQHPDYDYHKERHRYYVIERSTGRIVCDVRQVTKAEGDCEIEIAVDLFTKSGLHIVASSDRTVVGRSSISGMTFACQPNGWVVE